MAKRRLKSKITLAGGQNAKVHDRKATDLVHSQVGPVTVDDPYEAGGKLVVLRSLRDDYLANLHHHRMVDEAQHSAGRMWQRAYELAEVGGARAIDPTREAVDGGGAVYAGITEAQARALQSLRAAAVALGQEGEAIVRDLLGSHLTLVQAASKRGYTSERETNYLGRRFRECLDTLAMVYGLAMAGSKPRNIA